MKPRKLIVEVRETDAVVNVQAFAEAYARALLAELERERAKQRRCLVCRRDLALYSEHVDTCAPSYDTE